MLKVIFRTAYLPICLKFGRTYVSLKTDTADPVRFTIGPDVGNIGNCLHQSERGRFPTPYVYCESQSVMISKQA